MSMQALEVFRFGSSAFPACLLVLVPTLASALDFSLHICSPLCCMLIMYPKHDKSLYPSQALIVMPAPSHDYIVEVVSINGLR